jgi:pimeloyl-ACP methyl ester carboxylesterase
MIVGVLAGAAVAIAVSNLPAMAQAAWETVPDPAPLGPADDSGMADVNSTKIYYEIHGTSGPWIIFLHGGLGSALAWGNQVPDFAAHNRVLLIEARGHGRSGWDGKPITYDAMSSDTIGVMDKLGIAKADIVGWSDGAIVGLIMGIDYPDRVSRIVADGANTDPEGVDVAAFDKVPYNLPSDRDQATKMWENEPHITDQLGKITAPVLVMAAEHDLILPAHTQMIADSIPGAKLVIIPDAAHFIVWQQPKAFTAAVKTFLGVE